MQSNVYVTASGPALSLLLYENTKNPAHQVGFLLGAVVNQVTDTISDTQMRGEKTETIINISSVLPIPISSFVCNGAGRIDREKLISIVKSEKIKQSKDSSQVHDIVGWYTLYRNSSYSLCMRQRVMHQQLAAMAKELSQDCAPDLFVLCLLQNNLTSQATHVFKHSFMRYIHDKRAFELIPLQIHNLGMSQSSQYQNTACAPSRAELLKKLFDKVSSDKQGKDHMLLVQSELQKLLNSRVHDLSSVERTRLKLEKDIDHLREQLKTLQEEQRAKRLSSNGSSNMYEGPNPTGKQNNTRMSISRAEADVDQGSGRHDPNDQDNGFKTECTSPVLGTTRRGRINKAASQEY